MAIQSVSEERQVTFTPDAKKTVIRKTDVYLQPHIAEIENTPSLKADFSQQITVALNQQVNEILDLRKHTVIDKTDVKWFSAGIRDYGRLILMSDPPEAKVYLRTQADVYDEGVTVVQRVYPVGTYLFELQKDGCTPVQRSVEIKKNQVWQENVKLACR